MEHNFTYIGNMTNPLLAMYSEVDNASNHFLTYCLLAIITFVTLMVTLRKTQDIAKSTIYALYANFTFSFLLFFAGKVVEVPFMDDVYFLVISVMLVFGIVANRFMTSDNL